MLDYFVATASHSCRLITGYLHRSSISDFFVEAALFRVEERELSRATERTGQARAMSQRQIAFKISPRLGVPNNIRFTVPFDVRVSIFWNFVPNEGLLTVEKEENVINNSDGYSQSSGSFTRNSSPHDSRSASRVPPLNCLDMLDLLPTVIMCHGA